MIDQINQRNRNNRGVDFNQKELKIEDNFDEDSYKDHEDHTGREEMKFEMLISGGDYSPNSHTFFK